MVLTDLRTVTCRPALPQDTEDVLELTKTIWEGHDYVPRVWQDWLADPEGLLAVAEYGGHVIGLAKLTHLAGDEWWLEGLRVHPQYQGKGIAAHLHDYLLEYWQRNAGGVVRLATGSFNVKVQQMSERRGFRKIAEFVPYVWCSSTDEHTSTTQTPWFSVRENEIQSAIAFVLSNPLLSLSAGLMDLDWQWGRVNRERLAQAVDEQRAWWWRKREGLIIQRLDQDDDIVFPVIQLLACGLEAIAECLRDLQSLVRAQGYQRVQWVAPLHPDLQAALQAAGFQRDWEHSIYIYEKRKEARAKD